MWTKANLRGVVDWLEAAYPLESCGLVLEAVDGAYRVLGCENLADAYHAFDPVRYPRTGRDGYVLNPLEFVWAEERGERVAVVFHSHPDVGDGFSEEDIAGAVMARASEGEGLRPSYPGVDYLVVSVRQGRAERATLYRFDGGMGGFVGVAVWGEEDLQGIS